MRLPISHPRRLALILLDRAAGAPRIAAGRLTLRAIVLAVGFVFLRGTGHAQALQHDQNYVIVGQIKDELGLPLSRVLVTLETLSAEVLQRTFSDSDGRFSFTGLKPGEYLLVAQKVHYHLETKVVGASEVGQTTPIVIKMRFEEEAVIGQKRAPWAINTSGPMFTSTADVEPWRSWYVEPWMYNYRTPSQGTSTYYMPQRLAIGLGHHLEMDFWQTFESNVVGFPSAPRGVQVTAWGVGNFHGQLKYQLMGDADTYSFFARPTVSVSGDVYVPLGKYRHLNPDLYGADQFGNGTWAEGCSLIVRKRFKPFELYGQVGDLIQDPTHVGPGYTFNNGITVVPPNVHERMVDGNLMWWAGAFEHVLKSEWGLGYVLEIYGQWQNTVNPFFGHANAPPWSFLWVDPDIEFNWPNTKNLVVTWGFGVALPVLQHDFPRTFTPIGTATIYWNGGGPRGED